MAGDTYDIERRKRTPATPSPDDPIYNAGSINGVPVDGAPAYPDQLLLYDGSSWGYIPAGDPVLLARLGVGGVFLGSSWFSSEFAGLWTAGSTSTPDFESAAGYCCEVASEEISHFIAKMKLPSGSDGTVELWAKTSGAVACPAGFTTPGVASPTGIIISFLGGADTWENSNPADKITISKGDTLAFAMHNLFGFSPGSLSLFAHRVTRS